MKKMKNLRLLSMIALASIMVFSSCKREGCTDPTSLNYDPKAKKDDGSCTYGAVQLSLSSETAGNI